MRLVHLSDVHLGFRQFDRLTSGGINQREADVARSFDAAIAQTIALAPELVVVGGDIFHQVRPPNRAIAHALNGFRRLTEALPHAAVVVVAGNHDSPKTSETGNVLRCLAVLGGNLHIVDGAPRAIDLPQFDACVLAVPDNGHARPTLAPTGGRRFNVLLLHGETGGISPKGSPAAVKEIPDDELHPDAWDYIALGHYHVYREVGPRAFYSGAIDYTATNPWGELVEQRERGVAGKGIVERDLVTQQQTFHPLTVSRRFVELPAISARECSASEIDTLIEDAVEQCDGGIDGAVVRLIAHDLDSSTRRALDHKALKRYGLRALNFQLRERKPDVVRIGVSTSIADAVIRRVPIDQLVEKMLRERTLPANIDREQFVALGTGYMAEAMATEAKRVMATGGPSEEAMVLARSVSGLSDPYESDDALDALPALRSA